MDDDTFRADGYSNRWPPLRQGQAVRPPPPSAMRADYPSEAEVAKVMKVVEALRAAGKLPPARKGR